MISGLRENITKASNLLKEEVCDDQELIKTIKAVFNNLDRETLSQLTSKERAFVDLLSTEVPIELFAAAANKVSSLFGRTIPSSNGSVAKKPNLGWKIRLANFLQLPETISLSQEEICRFPNSFFKAKAMFENERLGPTTVSLYEIITSANLQEHGKMAIPILLEIINSIQQDRPPRLNLLNNPENIAILYRLLDFLSIEEFQEKHLEPFNKVFPKIHLSELYDETKAQIKKLDLSNSDLKDLDLSGFSGLVELDLSHNENLYALLNTLTMEAKDRIEKLNLSFSNVSGVDLSNFTGLQELYLWSAEKFSPNIIMNLSPEAKDKIRKIDLSDCDLKGLNLSGFTGLEELNLRGCPNVSIALNTLEPKDKISRLDLSDCNLKEMDLSGFTGLQDLELDSSLNVSIALNTLEPKDKISRLDLSDCDLKGVDLSGFTGLEELNLRGSLNVFTALNTLKTETKTKLTKLNISLCNLNGVNLSGFTGIHDLNLSDSSKFTTDIIHNLPPQAKANIRKLNLSGCDLRGANLSSFIGLEEVEFNDSRNFSKAIETLPNQVRTRLEAQR